MKRETDIDWSGKKNGNYIRLIYVLMLYKEEYEVETVSEILDSGAPVWQTNWLRLPKGGKKNLVLFLELLHEFKFWDFYKGDEKIDEIPGLDKEKVKERIIKLIKSIEKPLIKEKR